MPLGMARALLLAICLTSAAVIFCSCRSPTPRQGQFPLPGKPRVQKPSESVWRQQAGSWLGTPYQWGGHDRKGIDCSAFTREVYRTVVGIELPRTTVAQLQVGKPVSDRELRPGDLVFFKTSEAPVSHVGLWLGNNQFAHASTSGGVVISSLAEPYYSKRFRAARRILP